MSKRTFRKFVSTSLAMASTAVLGLSTSAMAVRGGASGGVWQPAFCSGATTTFVRLAGHEARFGFGGTNVAMSLINAGGQTAGGTLMLENTKVRAQDDFRQIRIAFKKSAAAGADTTVDFCFVGDHGNGSPFTVSRSLASLGGRTDNLGWTVAIVTSRDFGGRDVRNAELDKISFTLNGGVSENATIGDTLIQVAHGDLRPVRLNTSNAGCGALGCP